MKGHMRDTQSLETLADRITERITGAAATALASHVRHAWRRRARRRFAREVAKAINIVASSVTLQGVDFVAESIERCAEGLEVWAWLRGFEAGSDSLRAPRLPAAKLAGYPASFTSLAAPASPLEALANEMNLGGGRACPMRAQHLLRAGCKALRGYDFAPDFQAAQAAEFELEVEQAATLQKRALRQDESRRQAVAAVAEGELLCLRQQVELLRQEQARVRALALSPDSEAETPLDVRVTAWRIWIASKNIYISADALTDGQLRRAFEAGEDESRRLTNDREDELQRALGEQAEEIETLRDEVLTERKLAIAAAEGHDHVRGILLEIAAVFGRVDDLATLPARVRAAARAGP